MKRFGAKVALSVIPFTVAGCGSEGEGAPVAQLGAEQPTVSATSGVGASPDARLRRLWTGKEFNFYASSPSPDGRWVTEIDWSTGDLAVRDLTNGELHNLTAKGSWSQSGDYALASTFSPGGDEVAFVWWSAAHQLHELRALRFELDESGTPRGIDHRVVYSNAAMQPFSVFGWATDGRILAGLRRPDRTNALALVSVVTGEATVLESLDWRQVEAARSPDGGTIAYDFPAATDEPERDIYLLSADGIKRTAVESPADELVLGWLPDGAGLLFASPQPGLTRVYRLPMMEGSATGQPRPSGIELPGRIQPLGLTADALYVGVTVESTEFHVARLDDMADDRFASTQPFTDPYGGSIRAWDWSPDGSHFVHDARGEPGSSDYRVVVRSLDGDPLGNFHLAGRADIVRWGPDPRSVILYAWDRVGLPGLRSLDLGSGSLRTIRQFETEWQAMGGQFAMSPDGKHLYYRLLDQGAAVRIPTRGSIIRLNLETGEERPFHAVRSGGSLAFSPDGRRLAFVDYEPDERRQVIRIIPADGGAARIIFRQAAGEIIEGLNWTPDGRTLVFLGGAPASGHELLQLPAEGGAASVLADVPWLAYAEPRLHPDGRRIAFRAGRNVGEIWALDGIVPAAPASHEKDGGQ